MNRFSKLSLSAALSALLIGCGGGGGGDGDVTVVPSEETEISGSASKGVITNGKVTIWAVTSSGELIESPIEEFITSEEGTFSGPTNLYLGQMLYIEVRGLPSGTTKMYCDYPSCGAFSANVESLLGDDEEHPDTNSNGLVDFGEWFFIGDDTFISTYARFKGPTAPIRVNLLTHMVSQSFTSIPSGSDLNNAYEVIQKKLGLSVEPDEMLPLLVKTGESLTRPQIVDNMLMQGMLTELTTNPNMNFAIEELVSFYKADPTLESSAVASSAISASAIALTQRLIDSAPNNVISDGVKFSVAGNLEDINTAFAAEEDRLTASELPMLPPNIL